MQQARRNLHAPEHRKVTMQPGAGSPPDCHRKDRESVFMIVITGEQVNFQSDTDVVGSPEPYHHLSVHMYVCHIYIAHMHALTYLGFSHVFRISLFIAHFKNSVTC